MNPWIALVLAGLCLTLSVAAGTIALRKYRGPHALPALLIVLGLAAGQSISLAITAIGHLR